MSEYQKLALAATVLAGTLANRSLHQVVNGETSVVLSLAEAMLWQEELAKISKAFQSLDGNADAASFEAVNLAQIRDLQDQVRADGFKRLNRAEGKAFMDELSGDL